MKLAGFCNEQHLDVKKAQSLLQISAPFVEDY